LKTIPLNNPSLEINPNVDRAAVMDHVLESIDPQVADKFQQELKKQEEEFQKKLQD